MNLTIEQIIKERGCSRNTLWRDFTKYGVTPVDVDSDGRTRLFSADEVKRMEEQKKKDRLARVKKLKLPTMRTLRGERERARRQKGNGAR